MPLRGFRLRLACRNPCAHRVPHVGAKQYVITVIGSRFISLFCLNLSLKFFSVVFFPGFFGSLATRPRCWQTDASGCRLASSFPMGCYETIFFSFREGGVVLETKSQYTVSTSKNTFFFLFFSQGELPDCHGPPRSEDKQPADGPASSRQPAGRYSSTCASAVT